MRHAGENFASCYTTTKVNFQINTYKILLKYIKTKNGFYCIFRNEIKKALCNCCHSLSWHSMMRCFCAICYCFNFYNTFRCLSVLCLLLVFHLIFLLFSLPYFIFSIAINCNFIFLHIRKTPIQNKTGKMKG